MLGAQKGGDNKATVADNGQGRTPVISLPKGGGAIRGISEQSGAGMLMS